MRQQCTHPAVKIRWVSLLSECHSCVTPYHKDDGEPTGVLLFVGRVGAGGVSTFGPLSLVGEGGALGTA